MDAPTGQYRLDLLPSANLADLALVIEQRVNVPAVRQLLSLRPGGAEPLPRDGFLSLGQCNIVNGTRVYLNERDEDEEEPQLEDDQAKETDDSASTLGMDGDDYAAAGSADDLTSDDVLAHAGMDDEAAVVQVLVHAGMDDEAAAEQAAAAEIHREAEAEAAREAAAQIEAAAEAVAEAAREAAAQMEAEAEAACEAAAKMDAEACALLKDLQIGGEWDVVVSNAFSGAELCTMKVSPEQTLADLAVIVRLARRAAKPLQDNGVVFVHGLKVLFDGQRLQNVFPHTMDSKEPRKLFALEQDLDSAANTLHRARCDHILDSLQQYQLTVSPNIRDVPFGEALATKAYSALMAGQKLHGRVCFQTQKGIIHSSREESWSLSRASVEVVRVDEDTVPLREQMRRFGNVRIAKRESMAMGQVTLCVAGNPHVWTEESDFVNFWEAMTDRRMQAYLVGAWYAKQGLLAAGPQASNVTCWVSGGPRAEHLRELVRNFEESQQKRRRRR